ncbi:Uncharacterised protein [Mycobacteroides abscessus subsp. abscessus]|nr:Uncharacterised protein [Mycobacteroides abscessus subsp. abscessus]
MNACLYPTRDPNTACGYAHAARTDDATKEADLSHTIIKPTRDEDFYVVYSSVVDAPIRCGSRAELESTYEHAAADRFARADETGTSSKLGWYGFDNRPSRIVAADYGVSHTAILRIRRNARWAA